jgi:HK97 family phage portal protein
VRAVKRVDRFAGSWQAIHHAAIFSQHIPEFFMSLFTKWFSNADDRLQKSDVYAQMESHAHSYMSAPGKPVWMNRNYRKFAEEAYAKNVIAHQAIDLIAHGVGSIDWKLWLQEEQGRSIVSRHDAMRLLKRPNPLQSGPSFMRALMVQKLISGNAYIHAVGPKDAPPKELHLLRPDRVSVIAGEGGVPRGYQYKVDQKTAVFKVDRVSGQSRVLHFKQFHPTDDWYGLSAVEAAAYSIDQHNQAGAWNQALLQHGARPSGALVVNVKEHGGALTEDQYYRIKQQIDEQFTGAGNAGRPILLEGGLEWKEMSLSPKDMDFIEAKHSSARDIALAFGVPPQLLGIPGDNTYSNLAEARLALWEQTILPAAKELASNLNYWLLPMFDSRLAFELELESIPALSPRRDAVWDRANDADFLSDDEKREMVGV